MNRQHSRRQFVQGTGVAGLALVAGCGRLPGQTPPAKVHRVGFLLSGSPEAFSHLGEAFRQRLSELGYVEGENIVYAYRYADGDLARLPDLAAELVGLPVEAIIAPITPTARAAMQATSTIPIVTVVVGDPVGDGLVASLAHPGRNVTGLTLLSTELSGKRLELLRDTLPGMSRVAALWSPAEYGNALALRQTQDAASSLGLHLIAMEVRASDDLESVFAAVTRERADAFIITSSAIFFNVRAQLAEIAAHHRLPGMYMIREYVQAGGLMAYGAGLPGLYRQAAGYIDRILKGTKPADLPVERPMTFDFVVNMKTAQALGIIFPNEIMLQVTEVIQ